MEKQKNYARPFHAESTDSDIIPILEIILQKRGVPGHRKQHPGYYEKITKYKLMKKEKSFYRFFKLFSV